MRGAQVSGTGSGPRQIIPNCPSTHPHTHCAAAWTDARAVAKMAVLSRLRRAAAWTRMRSATNVIPPGGVGTAIIGFLPTGYSELSHVPVKK